MTDLSPPQGYQTLSLTCTPDSIKVKVKPQRLNGETSSVERQLHKLQGKLFSSQ